ncbi:MAG: staygreen family protein [Negativicutes bacterium]|nr:staygreen family protein [Negativicutes bacterium]
MNKFNPDKLYVTFRPGVNPKRPVVLRRYTLTHSDVTGDLFLTIGPGYACDQIGPMRDEVRAEWRCHFDEYVLHVFVYVGGPFSSDVAALRNRIFIRKLPLALKAIRFGDRVFFHEHPKLDFAPVWVHFASPYAELRRTEYWGKPFDYKTCRRR